MKSTLLLFALWAGPLRVTSQALQVAECDDLPASISTDTIVEFTTQEVTDDVLLM